MRRYYASDKKRREDAKRKQREEKRLKKLSRSKGSSESVPEAGSNTEPIGADVPTQGSDH